MENKVWTIIFKSTLCIILLILCIVSAILFFNNLDAYSKLSELGSVTSEIKTTAICSILFYITSSISSLSFILIIIQSLIDEFSLDRKLEKIRDDIYDLNSIECPRCKTKLPQETIFCPKCGENLKNKDE